MGSAIPFPAFWKVSKFIMKSVCFCPRVTLWCFYLQSSVLFVLHIFLVFGNSMSIPLSASLVGINKQSAGASPSMSQRVPHTLPTKQHCTVPRMSTGHPWQRARAWEKPLTSRQVTPELLHHVSPHLMPAGVLKFCKTLRIAWHQMACRLLIQYGT